MNLSKVANATYNILKAPCNFLFFFGGRKIEIMIANVPTTCRVEVRAVKAITFVAVYYTFLVC